MSSLADELKREHEHIADTLMRVKFLGVCSQGGQELLMEAKADLIEHLRKEDEGFYPALRKAAGANPVLTKVLDAHIEDMKEATALALGFFDKYKAPPAENTSSLPFGGRLKRMLFARGGRDRTEEEFSRDFERLHRRILERIWQEENTVYRMYEELDIPA
jgi:hypothetical protein